MEEQRQWALSKREKGGRAPFLSPLCSYAPFICPHLLKVYGSDLTRLETLVGFKLCVAPSFIVGGPGEAPESSNPYNKADIP